MIKVFRIETKCGSFTDKQTGELVNYETTYLHGLEKDDAGYRPVTKKIGKKVQFVGFRTLDELIFDPLNPISSDNANVIFEEGYNSTDKTKFVKSIIKVPD